MNEVFCHFHLGRFQSIKRDECEDARAPRRVGVAAFEVRWVNDAMRIVAGIDVTIHAERVPIRHLVCYLNSDLSCEIPSAVDRCTAGGSGRHVPSQWWRH